MRGHGNRCRWLAAGVAAILALGAIIAALTWPMIFDAVLARQLELRPGSRSFNEWSSPKHPLRFDIYLFNWTNADNFPGEIPNVEQLGPYSFIEHRRRVNLTLHPHNDSVQYQSYRRYQFDPENSNGTLEDNVTTLNPIAASAVYKGRLDSYIKQKTLAMGLAMFGQHVSVTKLARELMFEGYEDLMLEFAKSLPAEATGGAPKIDRFGWFYQRNNTAESEGYMEVSMGTAAGSLPGQILKWNYNDHLPYYKGKCSELSGSAGEFFPRTLTPESTVRMFLADLCRSINLQYTGSGRLAGLPYHRYDMGDDSFDHESACFCNGECEWRGVMNVSACRFGSPSFISLPHLLRADERLAASVTGLRPDHEKHAFYFSLEPKLGIPLDVAARFQLNIYMEPNPNFALYEHAKRMLFPVLWVEQLVKTDEETITELKFIRAILDWGSTFCAGVALILAIIVALTTCTNICIKKPKYSPPTDLVFEKPKDEAELKLNPL